jgi:uncharacterized protein
LLPCGLVYATLSLAVAAADPLSGALVMTVFGAATVPVLLLATLGLRRVLGRSLWTRRALAGLVLISGLGTLSFRAGAFEPADAPPSDLPPCHQVEEPAVAAP